MNNPLTKLYQWQINSGQLDGWTSYHLWAGLFIARLLSGSVPPIYEQFFGC